MASTDARPIPQKNVAYRVTFPILDADGDLVTGAAGLDSEVSKDAGTFADCTNEATEIATSSGVYYLDLTSTEMNADTVAIIVKTSTSGAKTTTIVMYPEETGDIRVNVTAYGGSAGTFASGRPEVNASHIAGSAVSTSSAMVGVNVVNAGGTAWGSGAITAASIATDAITNAKIAADAIGASEIADGAIDAGAIATGAITSAKFAAGAIDATAIASNAITSAKIATDAIGAAQIAADAIGASELAADAVTEIQSGLATAASVAPAVFGTSDSGTTTTMVDAARTESDTDYWAGSLIVFTSGNIAGQARRITAFNPGTDTITFSPATTQAVSTQNYEIWP